MIDALLQDVRYAIRALRKSPGFTAAAALTLALGATATLVMFTLVDAVIIRPLPFHDAARLIGLHEHHPQRGWMAITPANFRDIQEQTTAFDALGAVQTFDTNVRIGREAAQTVSVGRMGADIFPALSLVPRLGRALTPRDFQEGAPPVALLSEGLFEHAFGGSSSALGATVFLDGEPYAIVGVAPSSLAVFGDIALWAPVAHPADIWPVRQYHFFTGIGRLRAGVTLDQARTELDGLARRLAIEYPRTNTNWTFEATSLDSMLLGTRVRPILLALLAAACAVLVLGCINIANLLVARATRRQREIAVRLALGCGRGRLIRELLIEGALVCGAALGAAMACARAAIPLLQQVPLSTDLPFQPLFRLDARFVVAVLIVFVAATMLAALAPAWRAAGGDVRSGVLARAQRGGAQTRPMRLLTSAEVAITIVLLSGALVLMRSAHQLGQVPLGVAPDHVLMTSIGLDERAYAADAARVAYFDRLVGGVRTIPGVSNVAVTNYVPLSNPGFNLRMTIEGRPPNGSGDATSAPLATVSPEFFATLRIPLRRGRLFDDRDTAASPLVLLVNGAFARRFFRDDDPVGRRIRLGDTIDGWRTVIGVVGDVQSSRLDRGAEATMYAPAAQEPRAATLVVRADGDLESIGREVRRAMIAIDPTAAISPMRPYQDIVSAAEQPWDVRATILSIFAGMALLLAGVGVYGVVSFAVAQRTLEWGIRLAIGADPAALVTAIVGREAPVLAAAVAAGVLGAVATAEVLRAYVFGVSALDPLSLVAATCLAVATAIAGTYIPARRAARTDPAIALRAE